MSATGLFATLLAAVHVLRATSSTARPSTIAASLVRLRFAYRKGGLRSNGAAGAADKCPPLQPVVR